MNPPSYEWYRQEHRHRMAIDASVGTPFWLSLVLNEEPLPQAIADTEWVYNIPFLDETTYDALARELTEWYRVYRWASTRMIVGVMSDSLQHILELEARMLIIGSLTQPPEPDGGQADYDEYEDREREQAGSDE